MILFYLQKGSDFQLMNIFRSLIDRLTLSKEQREKKLMDKILGGIQKVEYDDNGFKVSTFTKELKFESEWSEINDIQFSPEKLTFITYKEKYNLPSNTVDWHQFVQQLPKGYKGLDYDGISNFFERLEGCEVCGLMAIYDEECIHCGSELWNESLKYEFDSKKEYIKEEQLWHFEPEDNEPMDISNKASKEFKSYADWVPLITKAELLRFVREQDK